MKKVLKYLITLILLLEVRFFYLVNLPLGLDGLNWYRGKELIVVVILIGILIMILYKKSIENTKYSKYIMLAIIYYIIQAPIASLVYGQSIKSSLKSSSFILVIGFYYILSEFLNDKEDYEYINNIIVLFSLITSLLFCIQAWKYNNGNPEIFLKIFDLDSKNMTRKNMLRLTQPSTLISLSIIISFCRYLKKDYSIKIIKILDILNLLFSLVYIVYVSQTRALTLAVILSCAIVLLLRPMKNKLFKSLHIMLVISIGLMFLQSTIMDNFISSFSDKADAGSIYARNEAIEYYTNLNKESLFLGFGVIDEWSSNELYYLYHGPNGYLTVTDIGIIGFVCQFGIFGSVWMLCLLTKLGLSIFRLCKDKLNKPIELIGVTCFMISTLPTLIITNPQRIILLPIIISMFRYYDKKVKDNIVKIY